MAVSISAILSFGIGSWGRRGCLMVMGVLFEGLGDEMGDGAPAALGLLLQI